MRKKISLDEVLKAMQKSLACQREAEDLKEMFEEQNKGRSTSAPIVRAYNARSRQKKTEAMKKKADAELLSKIDGVDWATSVPAEPPKKERFRRSRRELSPASEASSPKKEKPA